MVWGLFDGLGPLGALEERVTANYYKGHWLICHTELTTLHKTNFIYRPSHINVIYQ